MCCLTHFLISIIVADANYALLAKIFKEQVVLTFGMVDVVVVDADSKFLGMFLDMCTIFGY